MRTTVIPAQITTVEDKIAGNLNLTQILLLMVPVFWTTIVYVMFTPRLHLSWYKMPVVLIVLFASLILSLRIKGKVVLNWLIVGVKFNLRPKYYLFNKNDTYQRVIDLPTFEKKSIKLFKKAKVKREMPNALPNFSIADIVRVNQLIQNPKYTLSFKTGRKGGIDVDFKQVQK